MNNTNKSKNNTEDSFSERQDVAQVRNERSCSQSSGSHIPIGGSKNSEEYDTLFAQFISSLSKCPISIGDSFCSNSQNFISLFTIDNEITEGTRWFVLKPSDALRYLTSTTCAIEFNNRVIRYICHNLDILCERQDVTCSEGEAVTELSQSSGSPKLSVSERLDILIKNAEITLQATKDTNEYDGDNCAAFFAERCKLLGRDDSAYQCL